MKFKKRIKTPWWKFWLPSGSEFEFEPHDDWDVTNGDGIWSNGEVVFVSLHSDYEEVLSLISMVENKSEFRSALLSAGYDLQ